MEPSPSNTSSTASLDWQPLKNVLGNFLLEITESAILSSFEPNPISSCNADELPRIRRALLRARDGKLARFREPVTRNALLIGCLEYTENKPEEHMVIGYGSRHGSTTKVDSLHHVIGTETRVHLPDNIAHAMWEYERRDEKRELLIFHNHPFNPLNFLIDNLPLTSRQDRLFLEALQTGRVRFYLGENGFVKEFLLPSVIAQLNARQWK